MRDGAPGGALQQHRGELELGRAGAHRLEGDDEELGIGRHRALARRADED